MFRSRTALSRRIGMPRQIAAVAVALAVLASATASAQIAVAEEAAGTETTLGRVDLNYDGLPPASVEVDLSEGMANDLFGIGDAAIAGVAETLAKAAGSNGAAEGTQLAAEQLAAARQIIEIVSQVVREVRVRAYQDLPNDEGQSTKLMAHFDKVTQAGHWQTIVRAHEDENTVSVSAVRSNGAIRGLFVVASDGDNLVLVNVVCDISPENAKKLTSVATKTGLEAGLGQAIEAKMRKLHQKSQGPGVSPVTGAPFKAARPAAPPTPTAVPASPAAPAPVAEKAE
jgi:Domain of unknown function (DUF4252)